MKRNKRYSLKETSYRHLFEQEEEEMDALVTFAEIGAAWTLLYPTYQVVVPRQIDKIIPLGYALAFGDQEMLEFMNRWIDLKKKDKTIEKIYNHWILGKDATQKEPRWSIIRDVLHWVR